MENTVTLNADNVVQEEQAEPVESNRESILTAAYLPKEWWPDCYIAEDGQIFTPQFDANGKVSMTGEQLYQQWLADKDKPAEAPGTEEEAALLDLTEEVVNLRAELAQIKIDGGI